MVTFCDMKKEKIRLLNAFKKIDKNTDGEISKEELKLLIKNNDNTFEESTVEELL